MGNKLPEDILNFFKQKGKEGGKKSGKLRKGNSDYMRELVRKRWEKKKKQPTPQTG